MPHLSVWSVSQSGWSQYLDITDLLTSKTQNSDRKYIFFSYFTIHLCIYDIDIHWIFFFLKNIMLLKIDKYPFNISNYFCWSDWPSCGGDNCLVFSGQIELYPPGPQNTVFSDKEWKIDLKFKNIFYSLLLL